MDEQRIDEVKKNLDECVKRGIEFLDQNYPNWRERIDWHEFRFRSSEKCIAGQLKFYNSMDSLALINLGFDISIPFFNEFFGGGIFDPYTYLHDAWIMMSLEEE